MHGKILANFKDFRYLHNENKKKKIHLYVKRPHVTHYAINIRTGSGTKTEPTTVVEVFSLGSTSWPCRLFS